MSIIGYVVKMQYMGFSLKVLWKWLLWRQERRQWMELVLNCVQLCSFILVVLNPQFSLTGYQLQFVKVSEGKYLKTWHTKGEELKVVYIPLVWMSIGGHHLCCGSYVKSINIVTRIQDGQIYFNSWQSQCSFHGILGLHSSVDKHSIIIDY